MIVGGVIRGSEGPRFYRFRRQ